MRKYYIVTTQAVLEENKPLVAHCAIFRTGQEAKKFCEYLDTKITKAPKDILEVQVEELHLVTTLDDYKRETIIGFGDAPEAAEQVKEKYLHYFPTHSFSVRPFQQSDFIVKQGAFYA